MLISQYEKMHKAVKHIPNILTVTNLFLGCMAIVKIFGNDTQTACLLIFIAAVVDFADGFVARLLDAKSDMGGQLDSLAGVVSLGVVPGMILFQLLGNALRMEANAFYPTDYYFLPAFVISCASAYRLARFNLTANEQTDRFIGLPTPAMALLVASLPIILFSGSTLIGHYILNKYVLYALLFVLSNLMLSSWPLLNLKPTAYTWQGNQTRVLLLVGSLALIIWLKFIAVPLIFALYLALSFVQFFILEKKGKAH